MALVLVDDSAALDHSLLDLLVIKVPLRHSASGAASDSREQRLMTKIGNPSAAEFQITVDARVEDTALAHAIAEHREG